MSAQPPFIFSRKTHLAFMCPEHGAFTEIVASSRVAAAPAPPRLTNGCQAPVDRAFAPFSGICARVSPWIRSREDDDPGDEDSGVEP